jgi:hypothetical protein
VLIIFWVGCWTFVIGTMWKDRSINLMHILLAFVLAPVIAGYKVWLRFKSSGPHPNYIKDIMAVSNDTSS